MCVAVLMPVLLQHTEDPQVDPMVVKPLGFPQGTLLQESQPPGNRFTSAVAGRAADFDALQPIVTESFGHDRMAGPSHDAPAFIRSVQPVADAGAAVPLVDRMQPDPATECSLEPDIHSQAEAGSVVDLPLPDKIQQVALLKSIGYPGQPV